MPKSYGPATTVILWILLGVALATTVACDPMASAAGDRQLLVGRETQYFQLSVQRDLTEMQLAARRERGPFAGLVALRTAEYVPAGADTSQLSGKARPFARRRYPRVSVRSRSFDSREHAVDFVLRLARELRGSDVIFYFDNTVVSFTHDYLESREQEGEYWKLLQRYRRRVDAEIVTDEGQMSLEEFTALVDRMTR